MLAPRASHTRADWLIPAGLILLSVLPLVGGTLRIIDLAVGEPAPGSARFFASPVPIVLHVISSVTYFVLGAFQFSPSLRRLKPVWHRRAGYVLIPSGLVSALSGAWMAYFYPPLLGTGTAAAIIRIVVAVGIAGFICAGFLAIRERKIAALSRSRWRRSSCSPSSMVRLGTRWVSRRDGCSTCWWPSG